MNSENSLLPKIDADVPMPCPKYDYVGALSSMEVGQSFTFPPRDKSAIRKAAELVRVGIHTDFLKGTTEPRVWLTSVSGSSVSARVSRSDVYLQQLKQWSSRCERNDFIGTAKVLCSILPPRFEGGIRELGRVLAILAKIGNSGVTVVSVDTKRGNTYRVDLASMKSDSATISTSD